MDPTPKEDVVRVATYRPFFATDEEMEKITSFCNARRVKWAPAFCFLIEQYESSLAKRENQELVKRIEALEEKKAKEPERPNIVMRVVPKTFGGNENE